MYKRRVSSYCNFIPIADLLGDFELLDDCFLLPVFTSTFDSFERWLDVSDGFNDLSKISSSLSEAPASSLSNANRLQGNLRNCQTNQQCQIRKKNSSRLSDELPHLLFVTLRNPIFGYDFALSMNLIVFRRIFERTSVKQKNLDLLADLNERINEIVKSTHIKCVHDASQSGLYFAPISKACFLKVALAGF